MAQGKGKNTERKSFVSACKELYSELVKLKPMGFAPHDPRHDALPGNGYVWLQVVPQAQAHEHYLRRKGRRYGHHPAHQKALPRGTLLLKGAANGTKEICRLKKTQLPVVRCCAWLVP